MKIILMMATLGAAWSQESWEPNPFLLARGETPSHLLASFLYTTNPSVDLVFARELADLYVQESRIESVNHDIAWVQMLLETSFLRFGGQVLPEQNNFSGLGALDDGRPGLTFPDARTGVRAHVQHLRRYGGGEGWANKPVHGRGAYVRPGTAVTLYGLSGTWASDRRYHEKLIALLLRLRHHAVEQEHLQALDP